jgi:glycosyltransferase involved in cell wall biosynthesis
MDKAIPSPEPIEAVPAARTTEQREQATTDRRQRGLRREDPLSGVRISVIIPAMNEAENLPHVLPRIPGAVHEVLLVDGHSTDNTIAVARHLWPSIRIIQQVGRGKGAALRSGFEAATGDVIVMLDADGSTDPSEIPYFVMALLAGAEFVKGSRFLHGGGTADMPFYRMLGNLGFVLLVRCIFGGRYTDLCYGYNAFWRRVLPKLQLNGDGFEIETMMNLRALAVGLRVVEVPSFEAKRIYGSSRLRTIPDGWRVIQTILRERSNRIGRFTAPRLITGGTQLAVIGPQPSSTSWNTVNVPIPPPALVPVPVSESGEMTRPTSRET